MKLETLDKFEPGNPFYQDAYHMGMTIGTNVTVMFPNFENQRCIYLIVIDTQTGERLKLSFPEKEENNL